MRAFLALNLDIATIRTIAERAGVLREGAGSPLAGAPLTWVPATKMHVTLKFFGSIDVGLAPAIADAVRPIAESATPVRVGDARLTAFPDPEHARVIVYELADPDGDVAELFEAIEARVEALGIPREQRALRPHVTLARTRAPIDVTALSAAAPLGLDAASATELVLYRSDLSRPGAEYDRVARFDLPRARRA